MVVLSGFFYDGQTSRQHQGTLELTNNTGILKNIDTGETWRFPLHEIQLGRRISGAPREIQLPERRLFLTEDHDALDEWGQESAGVNDTEGFLHRLETHKGMIFGATLVTVFIVWWSVVFGVPIASKTIAYAMPHSWAEKLGEGGLATLDDMIFEPSSLDASIQQRYQQQFSELSQAVETPFTLSLHFRDGASIGANAFALPNGDIIVTDQLIALAENDDEILSVLAHEIGHVEKRHGLQALIRSTFFTFIVAYMTGDLVGLEELVVFLPSIILESKYSRTAETEADDFSYELMVKEGIPLESFANILERLEHSHTSGDDGSELFHFLNSHPLTEERVKRFREDSNPI